MPDEEDDIPLDLILKEEQIEVIANGTMATDEKGRAITMVSIFMQTITNNPTGTRTNPNGTCTILYGVVRNEFVMCRTLDYSAIVREPRWNRAKSIEIILDPIDQRYETT